MQRLLVLVNGRYAATQCTTIQEPLVKFATVPKDDSHRRSNVRDETVRLLGEWDATNL